MTNNTARTPLMLGVALLPSDFPQRLEALKELSGLSWERMAAAIGVDSRQLHRWRRGTNPSGEAMLSLVRLATRVPGGLAELLGEDVLATRDGSGG
jgi:transcriptional regulator with XRE-family HTH domain